MVDREFYPEEQMAGEAASRTAEFGDVQDHLRIRPRPADHDIFVLITDERVSVPDLIDSGPTGVLIRNGGQQPHGSEPRGQGLMKERDRKLKPGESTRMHVELSPGESQVDSPPDRDTRHAALKVRR